MSELNRYITIVEPKLHTKLSNVHFPINYIIKIGLLFSISFFILLITPLDTYIIFKNTHFRVLYPTLKSQSNRDVVLGNSAQEGRRRP